MEVTDYLMHALDDKIVKDFISRWDVHYGCKLTDYFNYSRVVCLADFDRIIRQSQIKSNNLAVVSGGQQEPELKLIDHESVDILDYDSTSQKYNLDLDWEKSADSSCLRGGMTL
jgi:hypothetical protein